MGRGTGDHFGPKSVFRKYWSIIIIIIIIIIVVVVIAVLIVLSVCTSVFLLSFGALMLPPW
jgi:hypothetical protein